MIRRYALLDRDGTIICERHYLSDPAGVELLPGAAEGLRRLADLGWGLIVVTNQSGIGRGYFDAATLERIHRRMHDLLAAEGVALDAVYHCPHTDDDRCRCRKPSPGMVEQAVHDWGFTPQTALVIGDKCVDVELGRAVGATTVLVRTGYGAETERHARCRTDFAVDDLRGAAALVAAGAC